MNPYESFGYLVDTGIRRCYNASPDRCCFVDWPDASSPYHNCHTPAAYILTYVHSDGDSVEHLVCVRHCAEARKEDRPMAVRTYECAA